MAASGTATLRWTIANLPCTASTDDLVITTAACFTCGSTLTINHISGGVAPETKTVNYGTVTTSLSGASKCWITRNLGATSQAASATTATDAAAGWYWQFNRKQGYMVGPTPSWTITLISENSDWLSAQDPCNIELGNGWRIPTETEWNNTIVNGGWIDYLDTYNSVLKLHVGGSLNDNDGSLFSRGNTGRFWSSTQSSNDDGWYLRFNSGNSLIGNGYDKATGISLRCLKD